jgi:Arc/MetJ-type ribon-helix-helix transcriptional regulator
MISVRLSEEEYSALRRLCSATGARSVSDLTRDAMRMLLNRPSPEDLLGSRMDEFHAQMRNLGKKIEQLAAEISDLQDKRQPLNWDRGVPIESEQTNRSDAQDSQHSVREYL